MIHINELRKLLRIGLEFNIKYVESSGDIVTANNVAMTSSFHANRTINVKHLASGQIRTVRTITIISYNDIEVFL